MAQDAGASDDGVSSPECRLPLRVSVYLMITLLLSDYIVLCLCICFMSL